MIGSVFWIIHDKEMIPQTIKNVDRLRNEPDFSESLPTTIGLLSTIKFTAKNLTTSTPSLTHPHTTTMTGEVTSDIYLTSVTHFYHATLSLVPFECLSTKREKTVGIMIRSVYIYLTVSIIIRAKIEISI